MAKLAYEQAAGLAKLGDEVSVEAITGVAGEASEGEVVGGFRRARRLIRGGAVARLGPLSLRVARAVGTWRPDFILCPTYRGYGLPVMMAARARGIPYGIYLHGTEVISEARRSVRRAIMGMVLGRAALVATNSENTRRIVLEEWRGLDSGRVVAVRPGVHFEEFQGALVERGGRDLRGRLLGQLREHGVGAGNGECAFGAMPVEGCVLAVAACRLAGGKGIDIALRSVALALKREPSLPLGLVVFGEGPERGRLEGLIGELGLVGRAMLGGPLGFDEMPSAMAVGDFYFQPSQPVGDFLESFGISFVEAQAAGLPCVGTRWGGVVEAVEEGRSALLGPTGEEGIEELAGHISRLTRDERLRKEMGEAGRERARGMTWDTHSRRLRELIVKACEAHGKSSAGVADSR